MPNYFLDTSALAKRYHQETGSEYMDRILEEPNSRSLISHLSIVEFESVLAIKARTRAYHDACRSGPNALQSRRIDRLHCNKP